MDNGRIEYLSRRRLLKITAAGLAAGGFKPLRGDAAGLQAKGPGVPVLHATDLFRPHMDPDDHWDLACVYALAYRGDIDLKGVLVDYPPRQAKGRNPDTAAIAQMNFITGLFVPMAVGSSVAFKPRDDIQKYSSKNDLHGAEMVLKILRDSTRPVVINILGSSRDVALAGKRDPSLFTSKCAAIYLNAGTGSPRMNSESKLEYNVTLDRRAYAAMFDLPCPVYWMPCFEELNSAGEKPVAEYGTHYKFRQDEILPYLSDTVQNYFAYMFGKYTDQNWLGYLKGAKDEALLSKVGGMDRHMWCTAGFIHSSGCTVSREGEIAPLGKVDSPVFTFDPIAVECDERGVTKWTHKEDSKSRFIFHVRDAEHYQSAMTKAMKSLLTVLP